MRGWGRRCAGTCWCARGDATAGEWGFAGVGENCSAGGGGGRSRSFLAPSRRTTSGAYLAPQPPCNGTKYRIRTSECAIQTATRGPGNTRTCPPPAPHPRHHNLLRPQPANVGRGDRRHLTSWPPAWPPSSSSPSRWGGKEGLRRNGKLNALASARGTRRLHYTQSGERAHQRIQGAHPMR